MRFLLVVKQKRNVDAFLGTLRCLVERGHSVSLALQERDERTETRVRELIASPSFRVTACPAVRADEWAEVASLQRRLRDCVHYLKPAMRSATKLRARMMQRLRQDLQFEAATDTASATLEAIPPDQVARLDDVFALAEQALPTDALFDEFLRAERPDVLLLSPVVHFGPAQADLIASAQRMGIPAWMLLYSWDNLSTKGSIHCWPDRMFVWNEQQKKEAEALHGFPADRVTIVGAPRFDTFFALRPCMTREQFHQPLGLDPTVPTLLYVCSSRFVSETELPFIRRWLAALRSSDSDALRTCNVLVRPHPDIALLPEDMRMTRHRWPAMPDLIARMARPFDDDRAVVLQTEFTVPQGLYESIAHSSGVVGLNTTAELEAGIVGRPVFTIVADDRGVDGQSSTIHFHYLTREHGGFVSTAATFAEHLAQLDDAMTRTPDEQGIRAFIESFLRPHGIDTPVAPLFADLLEQAAAEPPTASASRSSIATKVTPAAAGSGSAVVDERLHVDARALAWLERHVGFGEVVYEAPAGCGEFVVAAVKRRGVTVVAFEPAYSAYATLCDNVLRSGCEAWVVPVPLPLAARDGLAEIKYELGHAGQSAYMLRDDINWRVKHRGSNIAYFQPACLTRLDTAIAQYRLPSPHHVRLSAPAFAAQILAGAPETLRSRSMKSVCVRVALADEASTVALMATCGWREESRDEGPADVQLVFVR